MPSDTPQGATSAAPQSAEAAYVALKRDLIRGHYAPTEKLLMNELKARYAIGVGPLREALTRLVGERLVTSVNQRGYRVAPMSLSELEALYDARAELEGLLAKLAIERGDDTWEAAILAAAHRLSRVSELHSGDDMLDLWDARHQSLHTAIVDGCGCPPLLQARAALFDQAQRYRHLWLHQTVFSVEALAAKRVEHAALIERVLARDAEGAARALRDHLLTPVAIIQRRLTERGWA
ncbi:transcriptional regulator [Gammaproteobacteria bacterium MFB021]|nr:transcriptional regulator [Gammaproteobacteria bacterium MFB021]